ncbi:MAG: hypothetical protein LBK47_01215 [Prevotellaceae bacterium]|nr:hypothetical protein [Prevotellaceae bacterium]
MKKNRSKLLVLCLLFTTHVIYVQSSFLSSIFTSDELTTQNKIVQYYDNLITASVGDNKAIAESYNVYMNRLWQDMGSGSWRGVDTVTYNDYARFFQTLNQLHLQEYYTFEDTAMFFYSKDKADTIKIYFPYNLELNREGKFMCLLKVVSDYDSVVATVHDQLSTAGDFSPTFYAGMISGYSHFDYNNKIHRLIAIVALMKRTPPINVPKGFYQYRTHIPLGKFI